MIRDDVLANYRPLRASVQNVLKEAVSTCTRSDWRRAANLLCFDLDHPEHDDLLAEGQHAEMLMDVALFELSRGGKRI